MSEAGGTHENWAQAWIDQQREKLRESAAGAGGGPRAESASDSLSSAWAQLGTDLFAGYDKVLRGAFPQGIPLGWAREHEQEWRDLAAAHAEYQKVQAEVLVTLARVQAAALDRVEHLIRERARQNQPFAHVRELYDAWIECGEQTYATVARSDEYSRLQAMLANAGIRLRTQQQKLIERTLKQFDLPTRAELNSMQRELRELRERLGQLQPRRLQRAQSSAPKPRADALRKARQKNKSTARTKKRRMRT